MDIDRSLVRKLISSQFPQWAHLHVEPVNPGGWDNRTFHLGTSMSVRLPSAACYAGQVAKEQLWLPVLAPTLPLAIPIPLAMGAPEFAYPWPWSIYQWLEGKHASLRRIADLTDFARDLANFLNAFQILDASKGPPPGEHNFFRGGPLATYDGETRSAIASLGSKVDAVAVTALWDQALGAQWYGDPVWVHGDVAAANTLVRNGTLRAVIDFGCCAIGDPACDTTIAWTFFSGQSRATFCNTLRVDKATWLRGKGWALWKALITMEEHLGSNPAKAHAAGQVIEALLRE